MANSFPTEIDSEGRTIYRIDGMQKVVSEVFGHTWPKTPVVHVGAAINVRNADIYRKAYGERHNAKITMMNMIQACVARAAKSYPLISGMFTDENEDRVIIPEENEIAVSGPVMIGDSVVPVTIKRASDKSLKEIADAMQEIVAKVKSGHVDEAETRNLFHEISVTPNIGISNIGMIAQVNFFTAQPIAPALAAMYVPAAADTPVVNENGSIEVAPVVNFCMAFNHKVLAAGPVAAYMGRFKNMLENPEAEFGLPTE